MARKRRRIPKALGSNTKRKTFRASHSHKIGIQIPGVATKRGTKSARQIRFAKGAAAKAKRTPGMARFFIREGSVAKQGSAISNRSFNAAHPRKSNGQFRKK